MRSSFLAALCLLAAVSCRRNTDTVARVVDPAPKLVEAILLDTALRAPNDTVGRFYITYDALGRAATISHYTLSGPADTTASLRQRFEYGSDTLAVRSTIALRLYGGNPMQRFDTIYFRHQNGVLVGDSIRTWEAGGMAEMLARRRTYRSGYIADTGLQVLHASGFTDTMHETRRTWVNRVGPYVLRQLDSIQRRESWGGLFHIRNELVLEPTVTPNPWYDVTRGQGNPLFEGGFRMLYYNWAPQYAPAKRTETHQEWADGQVPGTAEVITTRYQYTLRTDGYPARIREEMSGPGGTEVHHILLIYR
jgi:hypothetical protein